MSAKATAVASDAAAGAKTVVAAPETPTTVSQPAEPPAKRRTASRKKKKRPSRAVFQKPTDILPESPPPSQLPPSDQPPPASEQPLQPSSSEAIPSSSSLPQHAETEEIDLVDLPFRYRVIEYAAEVAKGTFHATDIGEFERGFFTPLPFIEAVHARLDERYKQGGWQLDSVLAYPGGKQRNRPCSIESWEEDWSKVEMLLAEGIVGGSFKKRTPVVVDIYWKVRAKKKVETQREAVLQRAQRQYSTQQPLDLTRSNAEHEVLDLTSNPPRLTATNTRLSVASETRSIMEGAGNHVPSIADRWTCHLSGCPNEHKPCYVWKTNHYAMNQYSLVKWNTAIGLGTATILTPPIELHLELVSSPILNRRKSPIKKEDTATSTGSVINITTSTAPHQQDPQQSMLQLLQYLTSVKQSTPPPSTTLPSRPSPSHRQRRRRRSPSSSPVREVRPITSNDASEDDVRDEFFQWYRDVAYGPSPRVLPKLIKLEEIARTHEWKVDGMRQLSTPQSERYKLAIHLGASEGLLMEIRDKICQWHEIRRQKKRQKKTQVEQVVEVEGGEVDVD